VWRELFTRARGAEMMNPRYEGAEFIHHVTNKIGAYVAVF
jgi:hypothetical protein